MTLRHANIGIDAERQRFIDEQFVWIEIAHQERQRMTFVLTTPSNSVIVEYLFLPEP
jgi:hypothetical protein